MACNEWNESPGRDAVNLIVFAVNYCLPAQSLLRDLTFLTFVISIRLPKFIAKS